MSACPGVRSVACPAAAAVALALVGVAAARPAGPARVQIDGSGRVTLSGDLVVFGQVRGSGRVTALVGRGSGLVAVGGRVFRLDRTSPRVTVRLTGRLYAEGRGIRLRVDDAAGLSLSVSAVGQAVLSGRGTYSLDDGPLAAWPGGTVRVPIRAGAAPPAAPRRRVSAVRGRRPAHPSGPVGSASLPSGR